MTTSDSQTHTCSHSLLQAGLAMDNYNLPVTVPNQSSYRATACRLPRVSCLCSWLLNSGPLSSNVPPGRCTATYSSPSTAMLLRTCHRTFLSSFRGLTPALNDTATSHMATHFSSSSHLVSRSRPSVHGARASSGRRIQSLAVATAADSFYAVGTSFEKLGLSHSIADAIHHAGFTEPAHIQVRESFMFTLFVLCCSDRPRAGNPQELVFNSSVEHVLA